jgi:membrane-anchored protein YejM (alkaline phosphatase superfamily)
MNRSPRVRLVCWAGGYFVLIGLVLGVLGLRYLADYPWPSGPIAQIYTVLAFVGQFTLLAVAPWLLLVLPLTIAAPRRGLVVATSVCLAATLLSFVLVDSLVFAEDRFHVSALALAILGWHTWGFAILYLAIFLVLCALLARSTWTRLSGISGRALASGLAAIVFVPYLAAQALHIWADATFYLPITSLTPYLPLYRPWSAREPLVWAGIADDEARDASLLQQIGSGAKGFLRYPIAALRCEHPARLPNILLIGIDAMRSDVVDARIAPNIERFSRLALRFDQHWSGGNGTRVGLFSLFYALPPTYWKDFYSEQRSPVLIDELQAAGYQLGIFPGNPPDNIVGLDRTAFRRVSAADLFATKGDVEIVSAWTRWLEKRDPARPFFGFLFFESAPGSCREGDVQLRDAPGGASTMEKRRACYDTAVHFADAQAGAVLDDLERRKLLDDAIVIVTSDHGQEFDENGLGFHGHGSSYSAYQLHTPFIVHWPGMQPGVIARRTSHNDLAPTLLTDVLGCKNPASDYSSGGNLFSGPEWNWLVAASYTGFAVVEPRQVTVSSDVYFETRDSSNYRVISAPQLERDLLLRAIRETSRFRRE